jgi:single-strand DNA-binding protein
LLYHFTHILFFMLKMTLIGNIGKDAEIKEPSPGNFVITFNVAHTSKRRDKNSGVSIDTTTWVRCNYWRKQDQLAIGNYLKKGTQVYVEGLPSCRAYTTQNGELAASMELLVNEVQLLGGPRNEGAPLTANPYQQPSNSYQSGSHYSAPNPDPMEEEEALPPSGDNDLPF